MRTRKPKIQPIIPKDREYVRETTRTVPCDCGRGDKTEFMKERFVGGIFMTHWVSHSIPCEKCCKEIHALGEKPCSENSSDSGPGESSIPTSSTPALAG